MGQNNKSFGASAKRVLSELSIIVVGVLVALTVNSWNQKRIDRASEREYVERLVQDARYNLSVLKELEAKEGERARRLRIVRQSLRGLESLSPDSIALWSSEQILAYEDPNLRLSTFSALESTGDLRLIQNEDLRAEIVIYSDAIDHNRKEIDRWVDELPDLFEQLAMIRYGAVLGNDSTDYDDCLNCHILENGVGDIRLITLINAFRQNAANRRVYLAMMETKTDSLLSVLESSLPGL